MAPLKVKLPVSQTDTLQLPLSTAPVTIHLLIRSSCEADNLAASRGIALSPVVMMATVSHILLAATLPGTIPFFIMSV
jgi:hypothetical protein